MPKKKGVNLVENPPTEADLKAKEEAQNKLRLIMIQRFKQRIEEAKRELFEAGYVIELFAGVTQPHGEIGVKFKVREVTPDEMEMIKKYQETKKITDAFTPKTPVIKA